MPPKKKDTFMDINNRVDDAVFGAARKVKGAVSNVYNTAKAAVTPAPRQREVIPKVDVLGARKTLLGVLGGKKR